MDVADLEEDLLSVANSQEHSGPLLVSDLSDKASGPVGHPDRNDIEHTQARSGENESAANVGTNIQVSGNGSVIAQETIPENNEEWIDEELLNTDNNDLPNSLDQNDAVDPIQLSEQPSDILDEDGDTLLHSAIMIKNMDLFYHLLPMFARTNLLNEQNCLFQTPLHLAVLCNLIEMVFVLLNNGARLVHQDWGGRTPLHIACERGFTAVIEALLQHNASCDQGGDNILKIRDYSGHTCLHTAVKQGNLCVVKLLVNGGADINIPDIKSGRTSLHFAVEQGDIAMVKYLLSRSQIDVSCMTRSGDTPLIIAHGRRDEDMVRLLSTCASPDPDTGQIATISETDSSSSSEEGD